MKSTVDRIKPYEVSMEIEVDPSQVEKAVDQAYRRLVKQVDIPGFRKGRAPRFILEKHLGKEALYREAAEIIIPQAFEEAVAKHSLEPLTRPQIEILKLAKGEPLVFKATVEVKPEVQLGPYKGIELEKPEPRVTEEEVGEYLKMLQEHHALFENVEEDPAREGDMVTISFKGKVEGKELPQLQEENYTVQIGSGRLIPGFEEQLVGARLGETRTVKLIFPGDYPRQELAGKEATFTVTIKAIKRKKLPPLDDEFAKEVSEWETLEELREDIRKRLLKRREEEIEAALRQLAISKVAASSSVEVPPALVEEQLRRRWRDLEHNLRVRQIEVQEFLQASGKTIEDLLAEWRPGAELDAKTELVLETIAKAENIQVEEKELEEEIARSASMLGRKPEELKENPDYLFLLKYDIMIKKAIDFIMAHANIVPMKEGSSDAADVHKEAEG
ncbi:MAG TPA: trigger factor [Moorella mulderi]|nr:trigger factor [Moorella mulderi]